MKKHVSYLCIMHLWGVFKDVQEVLESHQWFQRPAFDTCSLWLSSEMGGAKEDWAEGSREVVEVSVVLSPALSPSEQLDSQQSWWSEVRFPSGVFPLPELSIQLLIQSHTCISISIVPHAVKYKLFGLAELAWLVFRA